MSPRAPKANRQIGLRPRSQDAQLLRNVYPSFTVVGHHYTAMAPQREEAKSVEAKWCRIHESEVDVFGQIGGGGVALVHRGRWQGRDVALKTLFDPKVDAALQREYMDELSVMADLRHPNVITFLGANMTPPKMFFVMELCDRSLFDIIHGSAQHAHSAKLSPCDRLRIACEVAEGMAYLHSRSPPVVHRDLKPHNVLEAHNGVMKICDFGLVKTRNAGAGTPAYMAPELLNGQQFTKAVDVYAFGVLLCELYTGMIPFREYEFLDVKRAVCRGDRPPLPKYDTPDSIRQLIVASWHDAHARRPCFDEARSVIAQARLTIRNTSHCDELDNSDCLDDLLGRTH